MYKEFQQLRERKKELECLYEVNEILKNNESELHDMFKEIIRVIPDGYQYPGICMVRLNFEEDVFTTSEFHETPFYQKSQILVDHNYSGMIEVFYSDSVRKIENNKNPFLPEEQQLLNAISEQIGLFIFSRRLKNTLSYLDTNTEASEGLKILSSASDEHWKWRKMMAEKIVNKLDFNEYGVQAVYLIGSTKDATAGPSSDLDLILHVNSRHHSCNERLKEWIQGWSFALSEMNYEKTGYYIEEGLIDAHYIDEDDFRNKDSYASMIGSHNNSAWLMKQKK